MTNKLIKILFLLIILLGSYVFISKYDTIKNSFTNLYNNLMQNTIVPEDVSMYARNYNYNTFKHTNDFKPKSKEDISNIFYTILDNGWDEFSFYCPKDYESCIDDVSSIAHDQMYLSLINNYVSPYNSYINFNTMISGNLVYVKIDRLYSEEDISKINAKVEYIKSLYKFNNPIKSDDIKKIHDYIIDHTTYDSNFTKGNYFSDSYKANGALISGKSVCSGYADAMAIILDEFNIPNFKVSSADHVWNVVYINNKWLHVDTTWDDDEVNRYNRNNFFLIDTNKLYELDTSEHTFNKEYYKELK